MTYKPVHRDDQIRDEILSDLETRVIYEATKIQIELAMQLKKVALLKTKK